MNYYGITINNHSEQIASASSARVAVDRVMARFIEGEFKPCATVRIRFVGKMQYKFDIVADVPFDYGENGQGTKRETVQRDWENRDSAEAEVTRLTAEHPDWKFVRVAKREIRP